ncbi:hypothetical protein [Paludibacterium yongneupense]|uniref:hypothetical protein n=1 Tax=Paludibacterium yongneupense TaxID=400061 RepID=UPI00041974B0|nr:hypothetical protein [Paludibacterium yongneupense]
MITDRACEAIDWLFEQGIRENSLAEGGQSCVLSHHDAPLVGEGRRQLIVLNISSYQFRLVAMFDFALDDATAAHLAALSRSPRPLEGQALLDSCAELVNMICGAVNRGLSATFWHAGMSTPFALESSCLGHVAILAPQRIRTIAVEIGQAVRFNVTVCLCTARDKTLDFDVDRSLAEADSAGELELF